MNTSADGVLAAILTTDSHFEVKQKLETITIKGVVSDKHEEQIKLLYSPDFNDPNTCFYATVHSDSESLPLHAQRRET